MENKNRNPLYFDTGKYYFIWDGGEECLAYEKCQNCGEPFEKGDRIYLLGFEGERWKNYCKTCSSKINVAEHI